MDAGCVPSFSFFSSRSSTVRLPTFAVLATVGLSARYVSLYVSGPKTLSLSIMSPETAVSLT